MRQMLGLYCQICHRVMMRRPFELTFCQRCHDELAEIVLSDRRVSVSPSCPEVADIHSLWQYRGIVRKLILRAKVYGDVPALRILLRLVGDRPEVGTLLTWADAIVAAPSSLWSRVFGRFDLAALLAQALAISSGIRIMPAPSALYWRWRKQALRHRHDRHSTDIVESWILRIRQLIRGHKLVFGTRREKPAYRYPQRILLIDDVVTSGVTLTRVARELSDKGALVTRALTIARS
jgi:predicted amidophosphoribosyltransferase